MPPPLLDPQEQALLRGWMNRLGWPLLGRLYLDGADIAATRAAVLKLRNRLALHARHCRKPGLEAFWLGRRGDGAAWLAEAEAGLRLLLDTPAPTPGPADPVEQWLEGRDAAKLQAAGLADLAALAAYRRAHGRHWWQSLPGLGAAARRVEAFLTADGGSLDWQAPAPARPAAPKPALPGLFAARPDLSGAAGRNRAPQERCRIAAQNDYEAVQAWLDLREAGSHTRRGYRKEAERFLLWAVAERGKPLSALDTADCKAYRDFLFDPPPHWVNAAFKPRWSCDWRPFKGPLQAQNVKLAETILAALCEWLAKQRYLDYNPFDGLPPLPGEGRHGMQVERALDGRQWQWLLDYCADCAERDHRRYFRLWVALQLAYCTGLRLAELAAARFCDIIHTPRGGGQHWLKVRGKGGRQREVPLPPALAGALKDYAKSRGVAFGAAAPLVGKLRPADGAETPFSAAGLHRLLKALFGEAAAARRAAGGADADRDALALARMSAHWLRHTHATHALEQGAALLLVKENLGHASLATTSAYLHGDKDLRHAAMENLFRAPKPPG